MLTRRLLVARGVTVGFVLGRWLEANPAVQPSVSGSVDVLGDRESRSSMLLHADPCRGCARR